MAQPAPATTDRLPWLTEVPRTPPPETKRRRFPWEWAVALMLVLLIGAGAYWLGTRPRDEAPAPASTTGDAPADVPGEDILEIPSVSDMTESSDLAAEPVEEASESEAQPRQPRERTARRERPRPSEPSEARDVNEVAAAPPIAIPAQPVVRGRIIQIGAYPSKAQADLAWQYVVKRWPYLASKPRLVSPIEVRSTDGKATRMYRLQLATSSQAQSAVICQRLETSKVSCVVVY